MSTIRFGISKDQARQNTYQNPERPGGPFPTDRYAPVQPESHGAEW